AVTTAHVDVLGRALWQLPDTARDAFTGHTAELLSIAAGSTPEQFQRSVKRVVDTLDDGIDRYARQRRETRLRTWTDLHTGMIRLAGEFDPERGALLTGRLHNLVETMFHDGDGGLDNDQRQALALIALVEHGTA